MNESVPLDPRELQAQTYLMVCELRTTVIGTPGTDNKGLCGEVRELLDRQHKLEDIVYQHIPQSCSKRLEYCSDQRDAIHSRISNLSHKVYLVIGVIGIGGGATALISRLLGQQHSLKRLRLIMSLVFFLFPATCLFPNHAKCLKKVTKRHKKHHNAKLIVSNP